MIHTDFIVKIKIIYHKRFIVLISGWRGHCGHSVWREMAARRLPKTGPRFVMKRILFLIDFYVFYSALTRLKWQIQDFPRGWGGVGGNNKNVEDGRNSRRAYIFSNLYVKTKEALGGPRAAVLPGPANAEKSWSYPLLLSCLSKLSTVIIMPSSGTICHLIRSRPVKGNLGTSIKRTFTV